MTNDYLDDLLDDAARVVGADLYPHRCRTVISDLAAAVRDLRPTDPVLRITGPNSDGEYWLHIKDSDGKACGINLGVSHGPIASKLLAAASGANPEKNDG